MPRVGEADERAQREHVGAGIELARAEHLLGRGVARAQLLGGALAGRALGARLAEVDEVRIERMLAGAEQDVLRAQVEVPPALLVQCLDRVAQSADDMRGVRSERSASGAIAERRALD